MNTDLSSSRYQPAPEQLIHDPHTYHGRIYYLDNERAEKTQALLSTPGLYCVTVQLFHAEPLAPWQGVRLSYRSLELSRTFVIDRSPTPAAKKPRIERQKHELFVTIAGPVPGSEFIGAAIAPGSPARDQLIISNLVCSLIPSLPMLEANALFVDRMLSVIYAYLVDLPTLEAQSSGRRQVGLAGWQEKRVKELIAERLNDSLSIDFLASECSLSRSYFSRAFKTSTGKSPHQYMVDMRLERAKALLEEGDLSIAEISILCGFCDQSHLTRNFVKAAGATPSDWRRRKRFAS